LSAHFNNTKAFVPQGYVSLGMAAIMKFAIDCDNITSGFKSETPFGDNAVTIRGSYEDLEDASSVAILVETNDGRVEHRFLVPPLTSIQNEDMDLDYPSALSQSAHELRRALSVGAPCAYVLCRSSGKLIRILDEFWRTPAGEDQIFNEAQQESRIYIDGSPVGVVGPIVVSFRELTLFLQTAGSSRCLAEVRTVPELRSALLPTLRHHSLHHTSHLCSGL
jgi:hypothetical protein